MNPSLFAVLLLSILFHLTSANNTSQCTATDFTSSNGQIYTPGLAIVDSPQPCTPEGGDFLQIAMDMSGDGKLDWPKSSDPNITDLASQFWNVTIFLTSYEKGNNFTISNNTAGARAPLGNILTQEPGSTVSHVNWLCMHPAPSCKNRGKWKLD
jgi:hypothetical protein